MRDQDRRRHERYEVQGLRARLMQSRRCEVLMLSRGGMLVRSPVGLEPEAVVSSELLLDGAVFRSQARVAFVGFDTLATAAGRARLGLEFVDADEDAQRTLDRFLIDRFGDRP